MQSLRKWLYRSAGVYPTTVAALLAVAGAAVIFIIAWLAFSVSLNNQRAQQNDRAASLTSSLGNEGLSLLTALNAEYRPSCSATNLTRLRKLIVEYQYIAEIGIVSPDGHLVCTTTSGRIQSFKLPKATYINAMQGKATWSALSMLRADENLISVATRKGPFLVVYNPFMTQRVFQEFKGTIWAQTSSGFRPVWSANERTSAEYAAMRRIVANSVEREFYQWPKWRFVSVMPAQGTQLKLESTYPTFASIGTNRWAFSLDAALSSIIGLLGFLAARPRLQNLKAIAVRVKYLCDEQHVVCVYQPIVDLQSGKTVGCEVLMRLQDHGELYYPDEYIPSLISNGLTWAMDKAVISKALRELAPVLKTHPYLTVALNLFPDHIQFERIHAHLQPLRDEHQLAGVVLNLEIIEHGIEESIFDEIHKLRAAGYQISVDDFGTGYSNLSAVRRISPDHLKIDKSLTFEMEDNSVRSSLIPEIVSIARAVGAKTVIEGVENARQAELLTTLGAHFGQGYYFARPMPIRQFEEYLSA